MHNAVVSAVTTAQAVSANKDFSGAVRPAPQTVTKEQRLQLLRDRARYELHQDFRPKGTTAAHVHDFVERQRESKINHIDNRMSDAHQKLQEDRVRVVHQGRAKSGFNSNSQSHEK